MPDIWWNILRSYESNRLVRDRYNLRHEAELSASKALEISSAVSQGRAYFQAAGSADRTVQPLLLYYGVLSLSRACILFLSPTLREASLAPKHGLKVHEWQRAFAAQSIDFGRIEVKLERGGTLEQFGLATGYRTFVRHNSSGVSLRFPSKPPPPGSLIALGDIVGRLPDLLPHSALWQKPSCSAVEFQSTADRHLLIIRVRQNGFLASRALVEKIVSGVQTLQINDDEGKIVVDIGKQQLIPDIWDRIDDVLNIGGGYVIAPFPNEVELSKPMAIFVLSYFLGMLVRYFPATWIGLLQSRVNDACLPTLILALKHIETAFPMMIVDFLEEGLPLVKT